MEPKFLITLISFTWFVLVNSSKINLDDIDIPPFTGDYSHLESQKRSYAEENARVKDCGEIHEIPGDLRTKGPWVISIFLKRGSNHKFLVTGTLVSPTLVLSILGGPYGELPKGISGEYALPRPRDLIIGAGLKSARLSIDAVDEHSQFSEASHILPFNRHHARNIHYHLFLIHLKSPFNVSTNYVRPICVHLDPRSYVSIVQAKPHQYVPDLPRTFNWKGYTAGYLDSNDKPLAVIDGKAGFRKVCDSAFKYYYRNITDTAHVYCTKYKKNDAISNNSGCWTHGSPMAVYFKPFKKWMIGGMTALIPAKLRGVECDANTLYFNANFVYGQETEWIVENILCGPDKFACSISGTCIPLSSLCNGITECKQKDDEESIFCQLTNHCKNNLQNLTHPCGFRGKCISPESLCNDYPDCEFATDEQSCSSPSEESSSLEITKSSEPIYCPPIPMSEGVKIKCLNSKNEKIHCENKSLQRGVTIKLSCKRFYSSKLRYSSITMKCGEDGFWDPYRTFACEPDCGIINELESELRLLGGRPTQPKLLFPWFAAIYKAVVVDPTNKTYEFACGGSLIESNVVITAAHCLTGVPEDFRVVLAPVGSDYEENLRFNETVVSKVLKYWKPTTYTSSPPQSDIAVLKLAKPVAYNSFIRPVCYFKLSYQNPPEASRIGKLAGFGIDETGEISPFLKFTNLQVVPKQFCALSNPKSFCAGDLNKISAVCKGDSGGGLVFPMRSGRSTVYVLKGITSHNMNAGLTGRGRSCRTNDYTVFTHLDYFANWMNVILEQIDVDDENLIDGSTYF